jgi:hypothetical protein
MSAHSHHVVYNLSASNVAIGFWFFHLAIIGKVCLEVAIALRLVQPLVADLGVLCSSATTRYIVYRLVLVFLLRCRQHL